VRKEVVFAVGIKDAIKSPSVPLLLLGNRRRRMRSGHEDNCRARPRQHLSAVLDFALEDVHRDFGGGVADVLAVLLDEGALAPHYARRGTPPGSHKGTVSIQGDSE